MMWTCGSRRLAALPRDVLAVLFFLLEAGSGSSTWDCSLPGLEAFQPGVYEGVQVNYLSSVTDTSSPQFLVRSVEFEACTGAHINFADAGNVFEDPIQDVGTKQATGKQLYDAYLMSYSHFPEASALELAETLNDRISAANPRLKWEDFFDKVKLMGQFRRNNQDHIDFLMFDGDFFVPIVRLDLLEKFNMSLPHTWDEVIEQVRFFDGKDLNDDGVPDFGFCHFPRLLESGTWDNWWAELVYSTWATIAQTQDSDQGFLFDVETFEPQVDTEAFREAARIWKELTGKGAEGCVTDYMSTGRCAIGYSPPGCWKGIFLNGVSRKDANGTVIWQPTFSNGDYAAPYRTLPFGSTKVLNEERTELVECTAEICPLAQVIAPHGHVAGNDRASILPASPNAGRLINRAPFYWSGGFGTMIRKSAEERVKDAVWDFFVYINSPETSVNDVAAYGSWIDSWRRSQLTEAGTNFVVDSTWPVDAYAEHRSAMWNSLGGDSNGALNLRIPGIKEYTYEVFGFQFEMYSKGEKTVDELVRDIKAGWDTISKEHGLVDQLQTYRATLGKEKIEDFRLCQLHRDVMDAHDPRTCRQFDEDDQTLIIVLAVLGAISGAVMLISFFVWIVMMFLQKRRLQQKEEQRQATQIEDALVTLQKLAFPMVILDIDSFLDMEMMKSHEALRDSETCHLKFLDTMTEIREFLQHHFLIFLSHQWLSYVEPDPDRCQYNCAHKAVRQLCKVKNLENTKVYVWCDYFSIPQRNKVQQSTAISSLPIYAGSVNAFIIIAPYAQHKETCQMCNAESYGSRAWCRAEVLSHSLTNGVNTMYIATKEELRPVNLTDDLMQQALYVFDGQLSCCRIKHEGMEFCDRELLMMPFLGLYGRLHHMAKAYSEQKERSPLVEDFISTINRERERIFPMLIDVETPSKNQKRMLFKGLLDRMTKRVNGMTEKELLKLGFAEQVENDDGMVMTTTVSRLSSHASSTRTINSAMELMLKL